MSLKDNQIILLNNLVYLDESIEVEDNDTVGTVVGRLLNNNAERLEGDRFHTNEKGEISEKALMNKEEWLGVVKSIQKNEKLCSLKITNIENNEETGLRAITFMDGNDAYIIFRGTSKDVEWHNNGTGGYLADTKNQTSALDYAKKVLDKLEGTGGARVTSGHSNGGNEAMYSTILDDRIDKCVAFDSQGMSDYFIEKYKEQIKKNQSKLFAIAGEKLLTLQTLF